MDMLLFCSDLDNTLIYSYKQDIGRDKILVDEKEGRPISYITTRTKKLLEEVQARRDGIRFVPVTTRSVKQYRRIQFGIEGMPEYALASNGGILLRNGEIDEAWLDVSKRYAEEASADLEKAISMLNRDDAVFYPARRVDGLFVFAKSSQAEKTAAALLGGLDPDAVDVLTHRQKLYVYPKGMHKGRAVLRLKAYFGLEHLAAAGDSCFDLPMLLCADTAIFPYSLQKEFEQAAEGFCGERVLVKDGILSEEALRHILLLCQNIA